MSQKDRQFVDALARGLAVLEAFSRSSTPLCNGDIAKMTGLAPSTVSRLTHTLISLGYLSLDRNSRRYLLTPKNLALGYPVLSGTTLLERARPVLQRLSERTGETAALAVRDGLHVTFMEVVQGTNLVAVRLATGARLPIAVSAAGIAALAAMPERERNMLATRIRADLSKRGSDSESFNRRLAQAIEEPVTIVRDAWRQGIGGLAVGLYHQGQLAALTLPVATGSVDEAAMRGPLGDALLEALAYLGSDSAPAYTAASPRDARRRNH